MWSSPRGTAEEVEFTSMIDEANYGDALAVVNGCLSCLKNGGHTEDVLFELLKTFNADDAVFLSTGDQQRGVDPTRSFVVRKDRTFLERYAENYWQLDPLYHLQFSPEQDLQVFKTDDVISFSQLINLEYYNEFLRPQDLLGELIIRLCSEHGVMGAISLQRLRNHPGFEQRDINKAQLIVPLLVNIFDFADHSEKKDNERLVFESWMEARTDGIILLDTDFRLLYRNAKATMFCSRMKGRINLPSGGLIAANPPLPKELLDDCRALVNQGSEHSLQTHSNRIISLPSIGRYYIRYFPLIMKPAKPQSPSFMVFINELDADSEDYALFTHDRYKLSEREELIAKLATAGMTNKQIGERLCISHYTVQNHLKSIFEKTGLDSRTKLANLFRD